MELARTARIGDPPFCFANNLVPPPPKLGSSSEVPFIHRVKCAVQAKCVHPWGFLWSRQGSIKASLLGRGALALIKSVTCGSEAFCYQSETMLLI